MWVLLCLVIYFDIMLGFTYSQWIEVVVMVFSLIFYFCGLTYAQQNGWSFVFATALSVFVVGTPYLSQT